MSNRYVALARPPKAWVSASDVPEQLPTITVHESDPTPQDTGLLDADGTPLYRVRERVVFGFQGRRGGNAG